MHAYMLKYMFLLWQKYKNVVGMGSFAGIAHYENILVNTNNHDYIVWALLFVFMQA